MTKFTKKTRTVVEFFSYRFLEFIEWLEGAKMFNV